MRILLAAAITASLTGFPFSTVSAQTPAGQAGRVVVPPDMPTVPEMQKGCDEGTASDCSNLGVFYQEGITVAVDVPRARLLYERGCTLKSGSGCSNLGMLYHVGNTVPVDLARAFSLYTTGCEGGSARGCDQLGIMYEKGEGVPQDMTRAVQFYRRGCDGGARSACDSLKRLSGVQR